MAQILLKGGTVLIHDASDKVNPTPTDILIEDDRITKIGRNIAATAECQVIDCTNKIVSPGFVDTHHHVWQTALKGLFEDSTFAEYMGIINLGSMSLSAHDMWWSNLAGSMEAIDAGTTTILDHAHMNWSPEHSKHCVAGSLTSGIRSIFAYTPTVGLSQTTPKVEFNTNPMADWVMETFERLAKTKALSDPDSLVRLGFGFDLYFLPPDVVRGIFDKVRSLGVQLVTSHWVISGDGPSLPALLKEMRLLDKDIVLSHGGGATAEDARMMKEANAFVASTPCSELSMAVGPPVVFRRDLPGMESVTSLGVDIHCATSSSLVNEMRVGLLAARGEDSVSKRNEGVWPRKIYHGAVEAFNLGTIAGARALNMEKDIGSIAIGKKADLVVFDALSPAMVCAAQRDPVGAVVFHSTIGDVGTVIVNGQIRKRDGKLVPVRAVDWDESGSFVPKDREVTWDMVAEQLLAIQQRFLNFMEGEADVAEVQRSVTNMLRLKLAE